MCKGKARTLKLLDGTPKNVKTRIIGIVDSSRAQWLANMSTVRKLILEDVNSDSPPRPSMVQLTDLMFPFKPQQERIASLC
jgi:hypothetical protein